MTAAAFVLTRTAPPAPEVVRFEMTLAEDVRLDIQVDEDAPFAISPDGKTIVFATRDSLNRLSALQIREVGQLASRPLSGTSNAQSPFFSPDGLCVGFTTDDDKLKKVPVTGGPPITLAEDVQPTVNGGSWGDDGYIIYSSLGYRTSRIRAAGGESEVLSAPDSVRRGLLWPFVLPGGGKILFHRCNDRCAESDLVAFDVATKEVTVLVPGATRGWYLPSGHLVYATTDGAIYAVRFDAARAELQGSAAPVLDGVRGGALSGFRLAVSASGHMIYLRGTQTGGRQVVEVDRAGRETVVLPAFAEYFAPRWSPTRDRIAVAKSDDQGNQIWTYDVRSQTLAQLTTEGSNQRPSWSPDGMRIAFYDTRAGVNDLYWIPADRSTPAERVADGDDTRNRSTTFESGAYQVYVRPFMREGGRWLISTGGAGNARWASNSEIIYRDFDGRLFMSAKLELGSTVRVMERTALFSSQPYGSSGDGVVDYDVSRDGQRFLMLKRSPVSGALSAPVVVLHWIEEVRRRLVEQGGRAP